MNRVATEPLSPWFETTQKALRVGGGSPPLLILSPPGSLHFECAREIHNSAGGGPWEHVVCREDSVELRTQLFGPAVDPDDDYFGFDSYSPAGAVHRATGGTLFLESVDRCRPVDADWIPKLLSGQPVTFDRKSIELDPSTRVIASITPSWREKVEHAIPQWVMASFDDRVVSLTHLDSRPENVLIAIKWFIWKASKTRADEVYMSSEAKDLLANHSWPGNYEELGKAVSLLAEAIDVGEVDTIDVCRRVIASSKTSGDGAVDRNRWEECRNCVSGLSYIGRKVEPHEVYQWASQFSKVSSDRRIDPWLPGLMIAKEMAHRYYYSADRIRALIRDAYRSLYDELAAKGYIADSSLTGTDDSFPRLQAALVNPLGPVKSASGILPHIAHLLGNGPKQKILSIGEVAQFLLRNDNFQVVIFGDDFAGTGQQIVSRLIGVLAADDLLQKVCKRRCREGNPIAFAVILGVSFDNALIRIRNSGPAWLPIMAFAGEQLGEQDRAFSDSSQIFPNPELRAWAKDLVIDQVGRYLLPNWPGGFDDGQALVVTADNVPNNTLPAIWKSGKVQGMKWRALFERASTPLG